jgi:sugar lactone lactonase YvrE
MGHGIMQIRPDGTQRTIGATQQIGGDVFLPNGIALRADGSFLIANMGPAGGVWKLRQDREIEPFLIELNGAPLGVTNFVLVDLQGRVWITITSRQGPLSKAFYAHEWGASPDGYIIVIDDNGTRVFADKLCFPNELRVDAEGRFVYLAETFAHRIIRFDTRSQDPASTKDIFIQFENEIFPDGLAFDAEGHLWVASLFSNRILRVSPAGIHTTILEECDAQHVENISMKITSRTLGREDVLVSPATLLRNPSSIAFGGSDRRTVYVGSLLNSFLVSFLWSAPGEAVSHWDTTVNQQTG